MCVPSNMISVPQYLAGVLLIAVAGAAADEADVLKIAYGYHDGSGYDDLWKGTGVPHEIQFNNVRILAKGNGSYCCGFTFAVAMEAAERRRLLQSKSIDDIRTFQKQWYGATEESREVQCGLAMERLGIGRRIRPADALPGDFLQFWRTNQSGHSVVFLDWVIEGGRHVGIRYRSSQGSTQGIGDRIEYMSGMPGYDGSVIAKRMYFGRLNEMRRAK